MADSTPPRARMTRDIGAGSASSGSPLAPPKASPCVLDRLDLARPRAHAAAESAICGQRVVDPLRALTANTVVHRLRAQVLARGLPPEPHRAALAAAFAARLDQIVGDTRAPAGGRDIEVVHRPDA